MIDPRTTPAPLAGRLEGVELPLAVCVLADGRRSGRLELVYRGIRRALHLREGRIVFASSTDPNDRLGESLLRQGKIRLDQLEVALTHGRPGRRLGQRLVDAGSLAIEELEVAVLRQIETVVIDVLARDEGEYTFYEGPGAVDEQIILQVDTRDLLLRALRTVRSLGRIRRGLGGSRTVVAVDPAGAERSAGLNLTVGETLILERLAQGKRSVDALCRDLALSNFEICRSLWAFKLLGILITCPRAAQSLDGYVAPDSNLDSTSFPDLLVHFERVRATGVLHAAQGGVERTFHIRDGRPVFATSGATEDGLVAHLFRTGVISMADRDETSRRVLSNRRVGTILLDMGVIGEAELAEMVQLQLTAIVHDTFRWDAGEFAFVPGPLPSDEEITIETDPARLIAEGLRRVTSWTRLLNGCGGLDHPLRLTPRYLEILDRIGAGVAEWDVANAIQTPQTTRRVCRAVGHSEFLTCQILWTFRLLGAVEDAPVEDEFGDALPDLAPASDAEVALVGAGSGAGGVGDNLKSELMALADGPSACDSAEQGASAWTEECSRLAPPEGGVAQGDAADVVENPVVEETIVRFNDLHRTVYRAVRAEIGAGAVNFVRSCCARLACGSEDPLQAVELLVDGSWDSDGLKRILHKMRIDDPWPAFRQLLDTEFGSLLPHLGETRAAELRRLLDASDSPLE